MIKNISNFLVVLLYIFRVFLPLINPLVATFNKTHAPTSKKYIAQQDIMMPNWSKIIQNFRSHSSIFLYIEKLRKNLNFQSFFPLIDSLVTTFNEMCAPTSKKYIAQQDIMMPNWSKIIQNFRSHSSIFLYIEKLRKNLNFQSFFPLIDSLVTTFNEMCAPTSKKNVAEQGTVMPNGSKIFPTFWSNPSVFFLYNNNLKYKFSEFFCL